MVDKVYLGETEDGKIYLSKHVWQCGWYWGFGHLGNKNLHYHFDSVLKDCKLASEYFVTTKISNKDWWIIRELMAQAYQLNGAYEVYYRGGANQTSPGRGLGKNLDMASQIKRDLEFVLDKVWDFACEAANGKK